MPVPKHLALKKNHPSEIHGIPYEVRDSHDNLLYIRERLRDKSFLTWTVQEGKWVHYPVPPSLPMYGNWHGRSRVMIHEGEKACTVAMDDTHPWSEYLKYFGHASVPGANSKPEINKEDWKDLEVYVVPDNDIGGQKGADNLCFRLHAAGAIVYRLTYHNLEIPDGWDFADIEFCQDDKQVRYPGKILWKDLRWTYAGKATYPVVVPGKTGAPSYKIDERFVDQFCYIMGSKEIYEKRRPLYPMQVDQFNHAYAHLSDVAGLSQMLTKHPRLMRVDRAGYHPGKLTGVGYKEEGFSEIYFNTHVPGDVVPRPGSIKPFADFLRHLIPNRTECRIFAQWIAMLVGAPEERYYRYAPLLVSEMQGVGKTTIAEFLGFILGHNNVSVLNTEKVTEKHNSWLLSCRLLVVEELLETGSKFRLYEALKEYITNENVSVRPMGVQSYPFKTRMAVLAFSNHRDALQLSANDRRWFLPQVTESKDFDFVSLRHWFYHGGGAEFCLHFAQRWAKKLKYRIRRGQNIERGWHGDAPNSAMKEEMLERTKHGWKLCIDNLLGETEKSLIVVADLHKYLKENERSVPTSPRVISDYLQKCGWINVFGEGKAVSISRGKTKVSIYGIFGELVIINPQSAAKYIKWFTDEYRDKYELYETPTEDPF